MDWEWSPEEIAARLWLVIIDAETIDTGEVIDADLCIVGAGPAGLTLARELIGSQHRVYMLESGDERIDEVARQRAEGDVVGDPYFPLAEARGFAVGGSSHLWDEWMRGRPLDAIDFESREWVPDSGWPFGRDELEEFYRKAGTLLGLETVATEAPDGLRSADIRPSPFNYSNTFDFEAMRREIDASDNVCLVVNCAAIDLELDESRTRAERVVASAGPPQRFSFSSRVFVLAGGGIEIPRLLLSGDGGRGIANSSDLVGRCFMEHPTMRSGVVVPADLDGFPLDYFEFRATAGRNVKGALSPTEEAMTRHSMLNCMVFLTEIDDVTSSEGVRSLAVVRSGLRRANDFGESALGHFANALTRPGDLWRYVAKGRLYRPGRRLRLSVTVEQAPNRSSRVMLSDRRDDLGVPRVSLDWRTGDLERHTVRAMQESVDALFRERGWGHVETMLGDERPPRSFRGEWHHLGTTRMSASPRSGVVDPTGRAHDIPNLYLAGGSVFPTVGYANPTLTVVALVLRMARDLKEPLSREVSLGPIW